MSREFRLQLTTAICIYKATEVE